MHVSKVIFTRKSGGLTCRGGGKSSHRSNFGCDTGSLGLVITKKSEKKVLMPLAAQKVAGFKRMAKGHAHWYTIKGVRSKTKKMRWKFGIKPVLNKGKYEVWYNEDLSGGTERDNAGKACYNVEILGSQIISNGGKCMKGDFKTLKAMGSGAHTLRATVTMPSAKQTANARQWILNLGQNGAGANHWLWSPTNVHKHGDLQFGRWNGHQVKGVSEGVTHDQMMKAASLTTTFDGKTYNFYIDGKLKQTTAINPPLNIKTNNLRVGRQPRGWEKNKKEVDFSGCVTKVEVWDSALTANELAESPKPK